MQDSTAIHKSAYGWGLRDSLPIAAGYIPIAFAFGVAAVQTGLSPWLGLLISIVVYAGGAQFVLLSLLGASGSLWTIAPTVWLLNSRHLLYGPAVLRHLQKTPKQLPTSVLAHGLTDEAFATIVSHIERIPPNKREHWIVGLQVGAYLAWMVGTALGCFTGAALLAAFPALNAAFAFVLPAFFWALLPGLPKPASGSNLLPILVAALVTVVLLLLLHPAWAITLGMLLGALSPVLWSMLTKPEHPDA